MVINVRKVCGHYYYWKFSVISIHETYESLYTASPLWHKNVLRVYCVLSFQFNFFFFLFSISSTFSLPLHFFTSRDKDAFVFFLYFSFVSGGGLLFS